MKRAVLFVVLTIVFVSVVAPAVQCFDGYYCEQAWSAHGMNAGWNFLCAVEVVWDAWENGGGYPIYP